MPHPIDIALGTKIRSGRLARGLTQKSLGHAIGVTFHQVQKYETAADRVSASRLWEIARVLGEPCDAFFPARPAPICDDLPGPDDPEFLAFAKLLHCMKPKQRSALLKLTRTLGPNRREPLPVGGPSRSPSSVISDADCEGARKDRARPSRAPRK
jgi:transcriptional regulator with XRE-family HTH domain